MKFVGAKLNFHIVHFYQNPKYFVGGIVVSLDDLTFLDESIEDRRKVNDQLVDLKKIPQDLKADILKAYIEFQPTKKMHLMKYLAANGATNLFTDIQDF